MSSQRHLAHVRPKHALQAPSMVYHRPQELEGFPEAHTILRS